jgi:photosystem I subunit 3
MRKLFAPARRYLSGSPLPLQRRLDLSNLTPCSENPAFLQKAKSFRNTTLDPESGAKSWP